MSEIKLSVVVASYRSSDTIESCLQALENQTHRDAVEVIVVDSSNDGTAELVAERFPRVRLFAFSERKYPGDARNIGVAEARGELLAFTDADCIVDRNWVEEILAAHQEESCPVIGGVVDNSDTGSYMGWGYYFSEFSYYLPNAPPHERLVLPTCCLSVKRWAFEKYGPFLPATYCSDAAFQWKLAQDGYRSRLVPTIRVSHIYHGNLRAFLSHEFAHARFFAHVRSREQGFSAFQRVMCGLLSPLLPPLMFCRTASRVIKMGSYRRQFVLSSPLVLLALIPWSWGECVGYLSTPHRSQKSGVEGRGSGNDC